MKFSTSIPPDLGKKVFSVTVPGKSQKFYKNVYFPSFVCSLLMLLYYHFFINNYLAMVLLVKLVGTFLPFPSFLLDLDQYCLILIHIPDLHLYQMIRIQLKLLKTENFVPTN